MSLHTLHSDILECRVKDIETCISIQLTGLLSDHGMFEENKGNMAMHLWPSIFLYTVISSYITR